MALSFLGCYRQWIEAHQNLSGQRWNKINRGNAIEQRPKYKPGSEPDRIRTLNDTNKRHYGID